MYGGLIMLGCGLFISFSYFELMLKKKITWDQWVKGINILVLFFWILILPIALHEYYTGQFSSFIWCLFLNTYEVFCLTIGLFILDILMLLGLNDIKYFRVKGV